MQFTTRLLELKASKQYRREERTLILQRAKLASHRVEPLLDAMVGDPIAPEENVLALRQSLAEHFGEDAFLQCESMGALVRENLRQIQRAEKARPART